MGRNRPITEDDVLLTGLLLAQSYGKLKQSVVQVSSDTLSSVGTSVAGTVKKHPYAAAGAAVGAGIILYGLFRLMSGSSSQKSERKHASRSDMTMEIISMLIPVVTPYVTAYLEKYLGRRS